eukprot:25491-Eustigmatos_ZCMA.PRE.1
MVVVETIHGQQTGAKSPFMLSKVFVLRICSSQCLMLGRRPRNLNGYVIDMQSTVCRCAKSSYSSVGRA